MVDILRHSAIYIKKLEKPSEQRRNWNNTISRHNHRSRQSVGSSCGGILFSLLNKLEGHSVIYHAYMFNSFLEGTRPTWDATDFDIPSWTEIGRIQLDELDGHTFGTTSSTILFQTSQHFTSTLQHANRVDLTLKILIPPRLEPADCRERR